MTWAKNHLRGIALSRQTMRSIKQNRFFYFHNAAGFSMLRWCFLSGFGILSVQWIPSVQ